MTINLKEFNWEQIKQTFWDLFIQITTIPAWVSGKEIDLTKEPLWLLIANIAFWFLTAIHGVIYSNATLKNHISI
ncbi:hypothetical protein [Spiroplasma endosymbiont of Clivina fossor]|uniref:hypothetical protein n=1 Tax=Spiroplasma endosymbiont of Clivina fossor TaxID=3066282 RepID=UPI00313EB13B